ncbi:KAP family P-loop NTPase fold protein [Fusobacterium sp. PH5-44]|uniref:KAP family P-loop NTPase fold protein n=1 Tax=unclassified Fusobacterium TaxID=2648384 RepID=UPI003D1E6441
MQFIPYTKKLTKNREEFLEQLFQLIINQFKSQDMIIEEINKTSNEILQELNEKVKQKMEKKIIERFENDYDCIQRIFIDSPWGSGKTFFCNCLEEKLSTKGNIRIIKINAWESDYFSDPMKSLIGEINEQKKLSQDLIEKAGKLMSNLALKGFVKLIKNIFIKKLNLNSEDIEELRSLFTGINESGIEEYKNYKKVVNEFKESLSRDDEKKVILIDELDRCRPDYAIELLEAVKHFFDVKNIIFVFFVNKIQLKSIVSTLYLQDDQSGEYFEKFFDLQLKLPRIDYYHYRQVELGYLERVITYEVKDGVSNDNTIIYQKIFFDILEANIGKYVKKPEELVRNVMKIFKKFKIILNYLKEDEKNNFVLMLMFIAYFLHEELWKSENIKIGIKKILNNYDNEFLQNSKITSIINSISTILNDKVWQNELCDVVVSNISSTHLDRISMSIGESSYARNVKFSKLINYIDDRNRLFLKEALIAHLPAVGRYIDNGAIGKSYNNQIIIDWCEYRYNFIRKM